MTRTTLRRLPLTGLVAGAFLIGCGTADAAASNSIPSPAADAPLAAVKGQDSVVFAGGCFWGIQAVFQHVKGVLKATAGYSGGTLKDPGYEEVSSGTTGHAESVLVVFDPSVVTFGSLLRVFFVSHDPTELNYQGPDHGTQYRSAIFFTTPDEKTAAQAYIDQLTKAKTFSRPIVTQVAAFTGFYRAEEYHQDFLIKNPTNDYIVINDQPKLVRLKQQLPELYMATPAPF